MPVTGLLLALIVVVMLIIMKSIIIVPVSMAYVAERLGRNPRVLPTGMHILIPFIDRIAYKRYLQAEKIKLPAWEGKTQDGLTIKAYGELTLLVTDVLKSSYNVDNYKKALIRAANEFLAGILAETESADINGGHMAIERRVEARLADTARPWGVNIEAYQIGKIENI